MEKLIMIEKRDGYKYLVGRGKYPVESIDYDEEKKRYRVSVGKNVHLIDKEVIVAEEWEAVDFKNKQYPSDY